MLFRFKLLWLNYIIIMFLISGRGFHLPLRSISKRFIYTKLRLSGEPLKTVSVASQNIEPSEYDLFLNEVRELKKSASPKKLLKVVQERHDNGILTQNMTLYTMKSLQRMNRLDLCPSIFPLWDNITNVAHNNIDELEVALSTMTFFCRIQNMDLANQIAEKFHFTVENHPNLEDNNDMRELQRRFLQELSLGFVRGKKPQQSIQYMEMMKKLEFSIDLDVSKKVLKSFLKETNQKTIREALRLILDLNGLTDNDSLQMLTSVYLRRLDFMKGAVSMETLPPADHPEICFIGRSNVGKSSLINAITNRKGLAFTSKTPGKTSEFNYFDAEGVAGVDKDPHRFYLVDLPGVGFAKVPSDMRKSWKNLLQEYVLGRPTLRAVFHLVDSRHGMLDADVRTLSLLPLLPEHVKYVIVLTKFDKERGKNEKVVAMRGEKVDRIYEELAKLTDRVVPIVMTSSQTRYGCTGVWSEILDAVAQDSD